MKKGWIILLIIILAIFVVELFKILLFAINNKNWNWFMDFGNSDNIRKEEYIRKDEKIEISNIDKINIDFKSADLNVFFTEDDEIRVVQYSYKELKEDRLFQANKTSSSINIRENNKPQFHLIYIGFMDQVAYDVYIPKKYEKSLEIKSISGNIEVEANEKLKFDSLKISSTSGDVEMGSIEAKDIEIETVSGDITLQYLENDNLKLKSVSGDISVEGAKGIVETKTTSGDIKFKTIEGKVDLKSTSGNINCKDFKVIDNSKAKTTSGNINLNINKDSNCKFDTKTTSGDVRMPNGINAIGTEPYVELDLETVSGNINLE